MCCQGNAMAAKACHGQGMGCQGQGMCCQGNAMAAKACHGQGMGCPCQGMCCRGCHGQGKARHGKARHAKAKARHAKAKAKACAAKAAMAKARSKACQGQGQGKASWHAEAKDKARLPGPRQCQPWAGKAGPFYVLLGLENTIDEICNYGHPNPTEVTPMSCFESRYASRWNCATLSERMQGQFTGCSGSKVRLTRYAGTGIQIQLRRFQLVVSSPDTHVERNPQP